MRNPIGTAHTPKVGATGATIFVKLNQFAAADVTQKSIDTKAIAWQDQRDGWQMILLHKYHEEQVMLIKLAPNTSLKTPGYHQGEEILVLDGMLHDENNDYPKGSWLRAPYPNQQALRTKATGTQLLIKTGHLIGMTAHH